MLWAPGWGAQKRMWVMITESTSPALGTEGSGKPKVFKPCRAVWGERLDWHAWSQGFKLGTTGWNHREAGLDSKLERTGTFCHSQGLCPLTFSPPPDPEHLPKSKASSSLREDSFPNNTALQGILPSPSPPNDSIVLASSLFTQYSAKWQECKED